MKEEVNESSSYKILLLGNSSVGKTSILLRFSEDTFTEKYLVTVGLNYRVKKLVVEDGQSVKMQIWDTSGEEKFKAIAKNFYRGAHGVLLVYDITNEPSFKAVRGWIEQINENVGNDSNVLVLLGNKCDDNENRKISKEQGEEIAKMYNIPFFETSAKENSNINEVFIFIANQIHKKPLAKNNNTAIDKKKKKKKKCC